MMTVVIPAGVGPGGQFAVPLPMPVAPSYGTRSRPKGNAAARRQYQAARRRGDGKLHKVHWGVIVGIGIVIILLILLLSLGGDGGNQGSGHNTPGYCKESATPCMASWTDSTQNGCSSPQEYCTNCDDSFYLCGNQAGLEVLFTILAASTQRESAWRPGTRRLRLTHPNV